MKLAYVSGKYRDKTLYGIHKNIEKAAEVAMELWRLGYAVICPHKNTALFDGAAPDDVWLKGDIVMLERCDLIVMVDNWRNSEGAKAELQAALSKKIPVYYWPGDRDLLAGEEKVIWED